MSSELTDIQAQLKEQTQQIAEILAMMKTMMSLTMPLLEEQANKLRMEEKAKAEEAHTREEWNRKQKEEKEKKEQMRWHREGASCSRSYCNSCIILPNSGLSDDEVRCVRGCRYSLSKQRPANDTEKSYMETFLRDHEYQKRYKQMGDAARWDTTPYKWIWNHTHFVRVLRQPPAFNDRWSCPNDDMVHAWVYNGIKYLRNYHGEIWMDDDGECGDWVGKWDQQRKAIDTTAPEPEFQDE